MKRDIYQKLLEWKISGRRKPLLLKGARQTGKTYILKEFGRNEYENMFYFNFEEDSFLDEIFSKNLNPARILELLSIQKRQKVQPIKDLIIFDEIQISNHALNSLKYFKEEANDYHIAAAGSLLGIKMSVPKSFPVGMVNFLDLFPMTFLEFLDAVGESRYRQLLEGIKQLEPLPEIFHHDLADLLKKYYYVGGMPEAVSHIAQGADLLEIRSIHKEILNSYILDFAKHVPAADIPKLSQIWDSIPSQLAKENKKFIFTAIKKSARGRDYEDALKWLDDAGLIIRSYCVSSPKLPLTGYKNIQNFKVYVLDVGLLGAMSGLSIDILVKGDQLFSEYRGAYVENYVAQQLTALFDTGIFFWKSEGKVAEIDFVYPFNNTLFPLEVKAGLNTKSKSLKSYDQQFQPPLLLRASLLNLKKDGKTCNFPLYALAVLPVIIQLASQQNE